MSGFFDIQPIRYEGPESRNLLAWRWYNPEELVEGKPMREHLRFSVAWWHTFRGTGADPFGAPTLRRPWDDGSDSMENARRRVRAAFEFMEKIGVSFFAFHDVDVAPSGNSLSEAADNLDAIAGEIEQEMGRTGIRLLWGTANLFSHPRYMHGAATSCSAEVFACAAAQVRKCLEVTHRLGGENYLFWGGREGYQTLWNTDLRRELDNLARLLHMAVDHGRKIGFRGGFLIEPKPKEPTKHQYDSDAAACINFLRAYGLEQHFKLNIETNHATLAGHSMMHELEYAAVQGMLGSIDANRGDLLLGWDTDQFPTDVRQNAAVMLTLLRHGGLGRGGVNFDAKVRRESVDPLDLVHAHTGAMDAFARGLRIAAAIRADGRLQQLVDERYSGWRSELGTQIENGKHSLESLSQIAWSRPEPAIASGRQELIENLINHFL
jgi:xylose isomerase